MTKRQALICTQSDLTTDYRVHKMAQTLRSVGYEVSFLSRSHPDRAKNTCTDTHIMRLLTWRGPLFYAEFNIRIFLYLLFHRRYDLIVAIDLDTIAGCAMGKKLRGGKLFFDSHEYFPGLPELVGRPLISKVWTKIQDIFVHSADVCATVCQGIADIFKQKYDVDFLVVRNAPLADREVDTPLANVEANRPFTLLYQGAVNIGRGVEETIRAMKQLPDCRLLIVGSGDIVSQCKQLSEELRVTDRVIFCGRRPFAELAKYMSQADLGLVLSADTCINQHFVLPNRIFDFVHATLPILANRLPEMSRIVEGENVGLCIDSISPDEIVSAVGQIRSDISRIGVWKQNMLRLRNVLTWENETAQLIERIKALQ